MVRYAKLLLPFDLKAIQAEILGTGSEWQPHINKYHYSGSWTVMSLRSPGGNHKNIIPDLLGENDFMDTIYMDQFPSVKKLLQKLDCPVMSARFLNLQAGAIIKQHTDNELAFEKGEARLHFPVFTNPGVEFYSEEERIYLQEGECWYLNANLPHRVANKGNTDRIHLVVDCKVNNWLKDLIVSSGQAAFKPEGEVNKNDLLNMIRNLRDHHSETSDKLADKLEQQLKQATMDHNVI
jgi:hypothetical protein